MLKSEIKKNLALTLVELFGASDILKFSLILIFSILYLPHVFVLVEDLGLISGYEVDSGSIISAIEDIIRTYNMHSGFHSKFYGWTYFSINYIFLIPIKVFCTLFDIESKFYLYTGIKLILFAIGLISMVAFYEILRKLFSNKILPFIGCLFYILSNTGYIFFYFLHPETTGIMFIFFALLCLLKLIENKRDNKSLNYKLYFYGLIFLVLASLSKQIFFFISLPILVLFFHFHSVNEKVKYIDFLVSRKFVKVLGYSIAIAIGILFVIHPYSILEFKKFLEYQIELGNFFSGAYAVPFDKLFELWKVRFFSAPIIKLSVFLFPISFIVCVAYYLKSKNVKCLLYIANSICIILVSCLIIICNRILFLNGYLQPLYPLFIINFLSILAFVSNVNLKKFQSFKVPIIVFFVYFIILSLASSIHSNIPKIFGRLNYKDSTAYLTYNYLKNNIVPEDKIVYDHFVALPDSLKSQGCHYWQGCGTDYINEYQPNYVIFNEDYTINDKKSAESVRLKNYVKEKKLTLVKKLGGASYLDNENKVAISISIFKKL